MIISPSWHFNRRLTPLALSLSPACALCEKRKRNTFPASICLNNVRFYTCQVYMREQKSNNGLVRQVKCCALRLLKSRSRTHGNKTERPLVARQCAPRFIDPQLTKQSRALIEFKRYTRTNCRASERTGANKAHTADECATLPERERARDIGGGGRVVIVCVCVCARSEVNDPAALN
jgi:hypothetical protein